MRKILGILFCFFVVITSYLFINNQKLKTVPVPSPTPVTKDLPQKFIVFGDSGTGDDAQKQLAKVIEKYPINFFLHTGDIAYPSGTNEELQKNFFDVYESLLKKAPFYPVPGNHDYLTDNLGPYLKRFLKERYYSFDKGPVHFVALDTNTPLYSDEMTKWLEKDLVKIDRNKQWIIVYFHQPPYSSGTVHGGNLLVQKKIVPILEKYKVNLVLSGHEHNYERMKPLNGITYIVTGGGSNNLYYDFGPKQNATAFRTVQTHFVYVMVTDCSIEGKVINKENITIDKFDLKKC